MDSSNGGSIAATFTVKDAAELSPRGRKSIAAWMRRQAALIESETRSAKLASRFTASYRYD